MERLIIDLKRKKLRNEDGSIKQEIRKVQILDAVSFVPPNCTIAIEGHIEAGRYCVSSNKGRFIARFKSFDETKSFLTDEGFIFDPKTALWIRKKS